MKKTIAVLLCIILSAGCFASCGKTEAGKPESGKTDGSGKLSIVTTIFPEYDWVRQILGEKAGETDLTMLLDNGVDLHSYQPSAADIVKISSCDLFIYVGGESDGWVKDALAEASNKDMAVINLLETLGENVREEEIKEGMQAEEEAGEEEEEEPEYDEHVWLSLKNAVILCRAIYEKLCVIDPGNTGIYRANTESYIKKLNDLDAQYKAAVDSAENKTLVFGDRFPFRYLAEDYGIDYYAAFAGCSAESEASFETIVFLAKKLDEMNLNYVMQIESADGRLSQSVIDASSDKGRGILTLDSMQSATSADVEDGANYYDIMQGNLIVLKTALDNTAQ